MYQLQKSDLKILRYLYPHKVVKLSTLRRKFSRTPKQLDILINLDYIITDYTRPTDSCGFPIGDFPPETLYYLSNIGIVGVEDHQWFDWQFVVRNIVLPIALSVISTLLTIFLSASL